MNLSPYLDKEYTVADYLLDRVVELGITDIFGVPGDFNLTFLDNVLAHPSLRWIGNNNELNAGYAADGYARVRGFGALITTFGVGELSAINAIAGAYAEYAPVLHIVGAPVRSTQKSALKVHHTLGDGIFTHFYEMARNVTCAQAWLTPANAAYEIDRVIIEMIRTRRPGYIVLSPDVAKAPIYSSDRNIKEEKRSLSSSAAIAAFEEAAEEFLDGHSVTILADLLVHRLGARAAFDILLEQINLPYATLAWGKTLVNECSPRFAGIYSGAASEESTRQAVENAERLITLGVEFTDNTTAGFTQNIDQSKVLEVEGQQATVGDRTFSPIELNDAIIALMKVLKKVKTYPTPFEKEKISVSETIDEDAPLKQNDLWRIFSENLPSDSIVLADQGTSFFGMADKNMPEGSMFIGQPLWGSIGYTLPATLGAGLADPKRRAVLLIGDGSAQLTVQEIASMIRYKTYPLVVLINNDGYTVERAIHGPEQDYNDIALYNWSLIPQAFGATKKDYIALEASTPKELYSALQLAHAARDKFVMLEIHMDKNDIPSLLEQTAAALKAKTKG